MKLSGFSDAAMIWWRFFWRYALSVIVLLLCGGAVLNFFKEARFDPGTLFLIAISYAFLVNMAASAAVFFYILNRKFKSSDWVVEIPGETVGPAKKIGVWFLFFWRFVLFTFGISFVLGALLPFAAQYLGHDPMAFLKYSKYIGNFSVLPASFLAFVLLVCREEKRRKLFVGVRNQE